MKLTKAYLKKIIREELLMNEVLSSLSRQSEEASHESDLENSPFEAGEQEFGDTQKPLKGVVGVAALDGKQVTAMDVSFAVGWIIQYTERLNGSSKQDYLDKLSGPAISKLRKIRDGEERQEEIKQLYHEGDKIELISVNGDKTSIRPGQLLVVAVQQALNKRGKPDYTKLAGVGRKATDGEI